MKKKTRIETNFRAVNSEDGTFSPHISKKTNERNTRYFKTTNRNKTKFVEYCINNVLDSLEKEMYETMSKEELIELLMEKTE